MINSILLEGQAAAPALHKSAKAFGIADPYGIVMAIIAMSVVFVALIMLYLTFKNLAKLYSRGTKKKNATIKKAGEQEEEEISGEINAAIALALHLYRSQLHDNEDPIITMRKVTRTYSPWSSKIYGLTRAPR